MYEIILGWATKPLTELIVQRDKSLTEKEIATDDRQHQIALEAIKTKNEMVLKRFSYVWDIGKELVALQDRIYETLTTYSTNIGDDNKNKNWDITNFRESNFEKDVHKCLLHQFINIRHKFELVNDLFSVYSIECLNSIQFENVLRIFDSMPIDEKTKSNLYFCNVYYQMVSNIISTLLSLLRVSSDDLRFWLVEKNYADVAKKFAQEDLANLENNLGKKSGDYNFEIKLESLKGKDEFWNEVYSR